MKDWTGRNKNSIYSTLGASNHSEYERSERDYYATHPMAMEALLEKETPYEKIWENACGENHLVEPLREAGYQVWATDIVDRGKNDDTIDFLSENVYWDGDIITNPPYKYAKEWLIKSMSILHDKRRLYMFLKLTFLEGKARKKIFGKYPPKIIYVFSYRVSVARNGDKNMFEKSSAACYAWFIWEKGFTGDPIIKWI